MTRRLFLLLITVLITTYSFAGGLLHYHTRSKDTTCKVVIRYGAARVLNSQRITYTFTRIVRKKIVQQISGTAVLNKTADTESYIDKDGLAIDAAEFQNDLKKYYISLKMPYDRGAKAIFISIFNKKTDREETFILSR